MAKLAEQTGGTGSDVMQMGMGAGFGMMMPAMIQNAMSGLQRVPQPGAATAPGAAAAGVAGGAVGAGLVAASSAAVAVDPKSMIRSIVQASNYQLEEQSDKWIITVPIGPLRRQKVEVSFDGKDPAGHAIVSFRSTCGPSSPENAMLLLQFNSQMVHGAFAVEKSASGDVVRVVANSLSDTLTALDVNKILSAVAWQADQAEEKLLGTDEH